MQHHCIKSLYNLLKPNKHTNTQECLFPFLQTIKQNRLSSFLKVATLVTVPCKKTLLFTIFRYKIGVSPRAVARVEWCYALAFCILALRKEKCFQMRHIMFFYLKWFQINELSNLKVRFSLLKRSFFRTFKFDGL